ncbi:MAG: sodium:solute symporter family protein [Phascolarctobacterium sp.]|jgi:transporter, solute:sodium symporter family
MELSNTHLWSLAITLLITLLPGIIISRKVKSSDDYNVGGRSAGAGMVAGSIIGTIIGGASTVGTAQLGFKLGLTAWWFTLGSGIALLLMAFFYAAPLRQSKLTTIAEFLVLNYGKPAGWIAIFSSCAGIFFSIVSSTLTGLHLLAGLFQVTLPVAAVLILVITAGFVFFGGISGSGMAGIMKMLVIFATIFVGGFWAFQDMGGVSGMHTLFPEQHWFSLMGNGREDALFCLGAMIIGVISTQTYIQALFSAKDSRTATIGCSVAALIVIPVGLPSVVIGMFMHLHHPEINSIDALPMYLTMYLPPWLGGMGLAGVLLSALSSIAGLSLGVGTLISQDIIRKLWCNARAATLLWASRFTVLTVTCLAIVFVFLHLDSTILSWNYLSMALRGSAIFLPLTFCIMHPGRIRASMGVASMGAGVFAALFWDHISSWHIHSLFPALIYNLIFLLAGLFWGESEKS